MNVAIHHFCSDWVSAIGTPKNSIWKSWRPAKPVTDTRVGYAAYGGRRTRRRHNWQHCSDTHAESLFSRGGTSLGRRTCPRAPRPPAGGGRHRVTYRRRRCRQFLSTCRPRQTSVSTNGRHTQLDARGPRLSTHRETRTDAIRDPFPCTVPDSAMRRNRAAATAAVAVLLALAAPPTSDAGSCREAKLCCPGRDSACVVQKTPINAIIEDPTDKPCYCDHACLKLGDCCADFKPACGGQYIARVTCMLFLGALSGGNQLVFKTLFDLIPTSDKKKFGARNG